MRRIERASCRARFLSGRIPRASLTKGFVYRGITSSNTRLGRQIPRVTVNWLRRRRCTAYASPYTCVRAVAHLEPKSVVVGPSYVSTERRERPHITRDQKHGENARRVTPASKAIITSLIHSGSFPELLSSVKLIRNLMRRDIAASGSNFVDRYIYAYRTVYDPLNLYFIIVYYFYARSFSSTGVHFRERYDIIHFNRLRDSSANC